MIKALRESERITDSNVALATLALTTAKALDEVTGSGQRAYIVDRLARAHLSVLKALEDCQAPDAPDAFANLFAEMSTPGYGSFGETSERL
jgi:hypothetical protein